MTIEIGALAVSRTSIGTEYPLRHILIQQHERTLLVFLSDDCLLPLPRIRRTEAVKICLAFAERIWKEGSLGLCVFDLQIKGFQRGSAFMGGAD